MGWHFAAMVGLAFPSDHKSYAGFDSIPLQV